VPLSLEASFHSPGGDELASSLVEQLSEDLERDVAGIGEVVGWDLAGTAGRVIVGGDERYEQRLLDQLTTHLGDAAWMKADHIDVEIFDGDSVQSTRRIEL
jgi:hypothetical protein